MGEARKEALRVDFDSHIKLEFHGATVTSDAGLVAYRELDEALGLTATADDMFRDPRRGKNTQHEVMGLLRQSVYSRLAGYEDTNDAERLAVDPAMRQVVGGRAQNHQAAFTSQMGRFETEILTARRNLKALMNLPGMWIDRVRQRRPLDKLILDLDSSVSETYGRQEGSAYRCNGGRALYNGRTRPGDVAGEGYLGNLGYIPLRLIPGIPMNMQDSTTLKNVDFRPFMAFNGRLSRNQRYGKE